MMELGKLAAVCGYGEITPELIARMGTQNIEADVFEMVRLVTARNPGRAEGIPADDLREDGSGTLNHDCHDGAIIPPLYGLKRSRKGEKHRVVSAVRSRIVPVYNSFVPLITLEWRRRGHGILTPYAGRPAEEAT